MDDGTKVAVATALRQVARGLEDLATALAGDGERPEDERAAALLEEWGDRGLTREEASALFRRHGFAPQTAGGWTRADWIESRDGRRWVTESSRRWLAERRDGGEDRP